MSTAAALRYTPAEYLARERAAEYKSEYVNGYIVAMVGASRAHNVITANIGAGLHGQLKERPCEVYIGDMRVKVSATGTYRYPDVVVACGDIALEDAALDTLLNPVVIVEVLSPTTEAVDRGEKFAHYRRLASLQEYVLVSQGTPRIERFARRGEDWLLTEVSGIDEVLPLASIDCVLALGEVYDKVQFPPEEIVLI
jgi:Uma2 family endonuclease